MKPDALLPADVLESYPDVTLTSFALNPTYYVSAPQLSWDCMMNLTKCELDLLDDPEIFRMLNSYIGAGMKYDIEAPC